MDPAPLRTVSAVSLPDAPDPLALWIKLDLLTRRLVGARMDNRPKPETDEALDRVIVLRRWVARRLVN